MPPTLEQSLALAPVNDMVRPVTEVPVVLDSVRVWFAAGMPTFDAPKLCVVGERETVPALPSVAVKLENPKVIFVLLPVPPLPSILVEIPGLPPRYVESVTERSTVPL